MDRPQNDFVPIRDARAGDSPWPTLVWPPAPDIRLTGRAIELTPCVPQDDAAALFRALDHDAVWAHVAGRPRDPDSYAATLASRLAEGRFVWIARLVAPCGGLAAGAVVGTSSYLEVSARDARLEIGATAYTPAVWSTKVNPEAKSLLLGYAFDALHAGRVQLKTDVRNVRSQRAIASVGATYEGTLRRHFRRDDGTVRDSVIFSIIAEEWPRVREHLLTRTR
jgi:RimJ/RimL family protein N-acetyltransferase